MTGDWELSNTHSSAAGTVRWNRLGPVAELLDAWELTEPTVIAHDSGGAIALGAHLLDGVRYRRLALVDAVSLPPWGSEFSALVGEHAAVFARLPQAAHEALLREYVGSASSPGLHPATLDALSRPGPATTGRPPSTASSPPGSTTRATPARCRTGTPRSTSR